MRKVWDSLAGIIVTVVAVKLLLDMVKPYTLQIIITVIVVLLAKQGWRQYRGW